MSIQDLKGDERTIIVVALQAIVVALQALHRERLNSYNAACLACELSGKEWPSIEIFGLEEVDKALRLIGAAPAR
ncbi:hypothetical protein CR325_004488 [Escherichia coli]|nr:hypothetical protein [Escherichia coli]